MRATLSEATRRVAHSREPHSAVTYGNSQQRISCLVLILGTYSMEHYIFGKLGRGGLIGDDLCRLSSNINSLLGNKHIFVPWLISHMLILNEIPLVETGI